ncbi:MAG: hypothetical protein HKL95_00115 [Phycisphaerae bacterium]|nr:hypothetical protein [Phycisphaerae bacterium]
MSIIPAIIARYCRPALRDRARIASRFLAGPFGRWLRCSLLTDPLAVYAHRSRHASSQNSCAVKHEFIFSGSLSFVLASMLAALCGLGPQSAAATFLRHPPPLLPPTIVLHDLWPDLSLVQKQACMVPQGMKPLYSMDDWRWFQRKYGAQARRVKYEFLSKRLTFAAAMLKQAQRETHRGRSRLLCLRVFALCYQSRSGSPLAQAAVSRYMQVTQLHSVVQIAPIWQMSNLLAYLAATPLVDRRRYDILAEQANVQLTLELLWVGQVRAAYRVVRHLGIHETLTVRSDHRLMFEMSVARTIVQQTQRMIQDLDKQYRLMLSGQESAAMEVYLYATVVSPRPHLRAWILLHWSRSPVGELDRLMRACRKDPSECYRCARALQAEAQVLPAGVLRNRVLFAALTDYVRYLKLPLNRHNRVERTLSRIAVQQVIEQGARPNPNINPLQGLVGMPTSIASTKRSAR